ncbi:MAG: hypothetical protein IT454_17375 [Planctomycetes bacterium]|nr:hypothetical protein [Planctomycetota bacterium]
MTQGTGRVAWAAACSVSVAATAGARNDLWPVWRHQGALAGVGRELAATPDGGVLIASSSGQNGELRALDRLGQLQWTSPLPVPPQAGAKVEGLAVLANGDIAALVDGGDDYFVVRFTAGGVLLGTASYGGAGTDTGLALASHPSGGYVVAGESNGGYGIPSTPPLGPTGGFVALHDANATEVWVRRIDDPSVSVGFTSVVASQQGEIRAYGWSFDALDPYRREAWASLSGTGSVQTSSLFGFFGDYQWAVSTPDGTTFTGSRSFSGSGWGADARLRRTLPQGGTSSWYLTSGLGSDSVFHAAASDGQGGIYAWITNGEPTWIGLPQFVGAVRYDSAGQVVWSRAEASSVNAAVVLPFDEVVTSNSGASGSVQRLSRGTLGSSVCAGQPNSSGAPALLRATGSAHVGDNALVLFANGLPSSVLTICAASRGSASVPSFAGGMGTLCLGGPLARISSVQASPLGSAAYAFDLLATPSPLGPLPALPGDTWHFQAWYRDVVGGLPTTNLSSSVSVLIP